MAIRVLSSEVKMKSITKLIKFLQGIKKNGGDLSTFSISNGIRDALPHERKYIGTGIPEIRPDGTFSITAYGNYKQHESNTRHKKSAGKKKGKK